MLPARPRRPRDKAKVEAGVLLMERWTLAVLRQRHFFSLAELNAAFAPGDGRYPKLTRSLSRTDLVIDDWGLRRR